MRQKTASCCCSSRFSRVSRAFSSSSVNATAIPGQSSSSSRRRRIARWTIITALSSNNQTSVSGWRGSITPRPTISRRSSSETPVCRQNSVIVKVTAILAIMLSPCLTRLEAGSCIGQLLPERAGFHSVWAA